MQITRKCAGCKQDIKKVDMIEYTTISGKTTYWYCKNCFEERKARERFSDQVCKIFGIKNPGRRIWTERKRLMEKFGFTDDIIVDCLDYIYNVENKKQFAESLCLVTPAAVEKMQKWKNSKEQHARNFVTAAEQDMKEYIVPIKENKNNNAVMLNPDDYLS